MQKPLKPTRRSFTQGLAATALYHRMATGLETPSSSASPVVAIQPSGITYLMSYGATFPPSLVLKRQPGNQEGKRFWLEGWKDPQQQFEWSVTAEHPGDYEVTMMVSAPAGTLLNLEGPGNRLQCSTTEPGKGRYNWDRTRFSSPLKLPQGVSKLRLQLEKPVVLSETGAAFKSLELLSVSERPAMDARIKAFRSDASWLSAARFGFMCQCGEWSYPPHGPHKPWPQMVDEFDVEKFAELVESTGAGYAIWSATWATYYFPAPIRSVESRLPGHTSKRDLIGDMATALRKRNLPLMLYYHLGAEGPTAPVDTPPASPRTFAQSAAFYDSWCAILQEVGEHYGDLLAGWMFDDELIYYPAPYEQIGKAAKAGSQSRILSYNPWIQARGTDFQDFQFGEGFTGSDRLATSSKGIWSSGPHMGLQAHGNFQMDGPDWGINHPETAIETRFTSEHAIQIAMDAAQRSQALSWNLLMFDDGTVHPKSLTVLQDVGRAVRSRYPRA